MSRKRKPVDMVKVHEVDVRLAKFLDEHPEMREANPEREQAFQAWRADNLHEEVTDDGQTETVC